MTTYNTGNPIGSTDARDLYDNAQAFDEAVNSAGSTYTDRRGVSRKTLTWMEIAATGIPAVTAAIDAQAAKTAAEAARDAAFVNANVYATKAAGLAATAVGSQFQVVENNDLVRYRVDAGPVAVEVARVKQSPKGSEIVWPTVLGTPTGWIDTGIRLSGAAYDRALLTNTDPSILFDGSAQSLWLDPSDLSTMFQDVAGTIPVTTPGQTVALFKDKSGNGNHFAQSSASLRPVYQVDAEGRAYLDMTNKGFYSVANLDWGSTNKVTVFAALRKSSDAAFSVIFETATSAGAKAFGLYGPYDANGGFSFLSAGTKVGGGVAASISTVKTSSYLGQIDAVVVGRGDVNAAVSDIQMDNGDRSVRTDIQGAGTYSTGGKSYLGGRVASYAFFSGRLYQFIAVGSSVDAAKSEIIRRYCAAKAKVSVQQQPGILPFVLSSFSWKDSAAAKTGFFDIPSCFAHVDFTTSANLLQINGYCTMDVAFPNASQDYIKEIGVYVNGVFHAAVNTTTDGPFTRYVSLPSGSKTVSVVVGPQAVPSTFNSYPLGTFVQSIAADAPMTLANPSAANRLLIYGDSIAVGDAATNPTGNGWAMKVRQSLYPRSVAVEAHGYRSLYEDAFDATARAAFVTKLASFSPSEIWLAIGTNDYGLNKWNAASFGTAYAALLDDLHTALPSAHIYCQTPIVRTNSGANGSGSTLADYRTQIANAVSTRTAYAELVDGAAILLTSDLSDGVHPSTAGHAKYATYALGVLA